MILTELYKQNSFLLDSDALDEDDRTFFRRVSVDMDDVDATMAIHYLSKFLFLHYGKKVIILLDEYDTPMQEAYISGFWDEIVYFIRNLFNASFKTNPWSILNFLDKGKFGAYWANTSSNSLAGKLIQEGSPHIKETFEQLILGDSIQASIDEQIVYNLLGNNE